MQWLYSKKYLLAGQKEKPVEHFQQPIATTRRDNYSLRMAGTQAKKGCAGSLFIDQELLAVVIAKA